MVSGVLLIDKPEGVRSRKVVDAVGRALGIKKVGHAGTLDPAATGLMAILVGEGTKLSQFLMEGRKTYRATVRFGAVTDTYDADGIIQSEHDVSGLTQEQVEAALETYRGPIMQVPPPVAAIKVKGKPAYKYAREGKPLALDPRPVTIYSLTLLRFESPELEIEMECSKGTYVRSLAFDLGQDLGVGGHLSQIRRIASSPHHVREAVPLDDLADMSREEIEQAMIPLEKALPSVPSITADERLVRCVADGRIIPGELIYGRIPNNLLKDDLVQIVTTKRVALTRLVCDTGDLGPPPWTGKQPLKYERILHR